MTENKQNWHIQHVNEYTVSCRFMEEMNLFAFVHLIQCTILVYYISVPKGFQSL